jgi:hypothetical protein
MAIHMQNKIQEQGQNRNIQRVLELTVALGVEVMIVGQAEGSMPL